MEARDVWLDDGPRRTAIDGDGEHHEAARSILLPERFECRHLGGAGLTPRRPEVQDHELVLEVLQRGVAASGERAELERGAALAFLQFGHARLLERIERNGRMAVMAAVLACAPRRDHP